MIDKLSITIHDFPLRMLTSCSENEILLLRYVNWSTNVLWCIHIVVVIRLKLGRNPISFYQKDQIFI